MIQHTDITTETICENDSEHIGVIAKCTVWKVNRPNRKIRIERYGKTKDEALKNIGESLEYMD